MADKKVSELTSLTTPASEDFLLVIDNPNGTPVSKRTTFKNLAANMPNTAIGGTLTVSANTTLNGSNTVFTANTHFSGAKGPKVTSGFVTLAETTVTSNNATTQFGLSDLQGSIFWDENYLYVATSNTVIKRVALSTFSS